jgi:hypothetical protein
MLARDLRGVDVEEEHRGTGGAAAGAVHEKEPDVSGTNTASHTQSTACNTATVIFISANALYLNVICC